MNPHQSIAHYLITSKLGEGGMGAVYRATDTKLSRDVAIKVLPEAFASNSDRLARFTREAQVLASLNHPNIAQIYGVEDRALVMELVEGEELSGPLAESEALRIIHQLVDALEYAHEKGIIHRDLKPANIKVTPEGQLKVLDFGLAKAVAGELPAAGNPEISPTLTMSATVAGTILGTAAYMAPEQARGKAVDKRIDIWAFGAIVYELLSGRRLFAGETISDTLAAVLTREPELAAVPHRFRQLLRLCLQRDPRQRLRDIGDARLLLVDTVEPATVAAAPASRQKLPWIIAGFATLAAVAAGVVFHRSPAPAPRPLHLDFRLPDDASFLGTPALIFSPDGKSVAFEASSPTRKGRVWVRSLDSSEAHPLGGTETANVNNALIWSADSRKIFFQSDGVVRAIPASGGPARSSPSVP